MRARIEIRLKPGVLDPEAAAIERALRQLGFSGLKGVARAKVIEVELEARGEQEAEAELRAMCERLLANPVIETYAIALLR